MTPVELTQAQQGLWAEYRADPQDTGQHIAEQLEFHGPLDAARLLDAVARMLGEVPVLHARFEARGDGAVQHLVAVPVRPAALRDLRGHPHPDGAADEETQALLDTPFALEDGELYRHALFLLGPERARWVLVTHHITLDGYGLTLCLERLAVQYRGETLPSSFGALPPVLEAEAAYEGSADRAADGAALRALYGGIPHVPAPLLDLGLRRGHRAAGQLPAALVRQLHEQAAALQVGWPALLFALSAAFWRAHSGERQVVLAVPVMGRLGHPSARVPCMVMNLAPLRLDVTPGQTLRTLAGQAQAALGPLRRHGRYRYEHLWADLNGHRLFGPEVNVIPFRRPLDFGPDLRVNTATLASGPVEDLALSFTAGRDALHLTLDGHPALYSAAAVHALHGGLQAALARGLDRPDAPVETLWPAAVAG